MKRPHNSRFGRCQADDTAGKEGAIRHLHMQHVKMLTQQQVVQWAIGSGQRHTHAVTVKTDRHVLAQAMHIRQVGTGTGAHQIMHIVTAPPQPFAHRTYILLHAVWTVERVVQYEADLIADSSLRPLQRERHASLRPSYKVPHTDQPLSRS